MYIEQVKKESFTKTKELHSKVQLKLQFVIMVMVEVFLQYSFTVQLSCLPILQKSVTSVNFIKNKLKQILVS